MPSWRAAVVATCVVAVGACGGGGGGEQPHESVVGDKALGAKASAAVQRHRVPALGLAEIADGSVKVAVAGHRSYRVRQGLAATAPFHLGSNTKAMTAALLATFVEDGVVSFDDSLAKLFPEITVHPSLREASLRDVMGHRAGLGDGRIDLPRLHAAADASAARAAVVAEALAERAAHPGEFRYANVNYMVLGVVAERLGRASWEALVDERVFKPLGIDCGFGAPTGSSAPLGHDPDGRPVPQDARVTDNPAALRPAGGVHCSLEAWARFAQSVLANARGEASSVMAASTAQDLFAGDAAYVAGWQRVRQGGVTTLAHDGSNTLWYARAVLQVDRDRAVLIATNTGESKAVEAMDELSS